MGPAEQLLRRLERYYDAVPRRRSTTEQVGPFTLFVATSGWPYYARPTLGGPSAITADDVRAVLGRQAALGVPQAIEWVHQISPDLAAIIESLGFHVERLPLMLLDDPPRGDAGIARVLTPDDADELRLSRAAVTVAFGHDGTARGEPGTRERDALLSKGGSELDAVPRERMATGELVQASVRDALQPELGPVGGGSYSPVDGVAEIAGVGILPAFRRRGLGAHITHLLASHALASGVTTVFCSASSDAVARVYEGIGFRRIGTACILHSP